MSRKILILKLWPKKLLANQIPWLVFQILTKNDFKEFSKFLHDDSGDDSLPLPANCMSRKILVLELWPKKLSANQIAQLIFQTLTKNDCKEFSEFLYFYKHTFFTLLLVHWLLSSILLLLSNQPKHWLMRLGALSSTTQSNKFYPPVGFSLITQKR